MLLENVDMKQGKLPWQSCRADTQCGKQVAISFECMLWLDRHNGVDGQDSQSQSYMNRLKCVRWDWIIETLKWRMICEIFSL